MDYRTYHLGELIPDAVRLLRTRAFPQTLPLRAADRPAALPPEAAPERPADAPPPSPGTTPTQ